MADAGVVEIAALALTAASTGAEVYQASQAGKGIPKPATPANTPKSPINEIGNAQTQQQQAELQAQSAAGTILSNPEKNANRQIGTNPSAPMKSLLGV